MCITVFSVSCIIQYNTTNTKVVYSIYSIDNLIQGKQNYAKSMYILVQSFSDLFKSVQSIIKFSSPFQGQKPDLLPFAD